MEKFGIVRSAAAPLRIENINTDMITRIERVANCPREELGRWAFEMIRYNPDGTENPAFVLNQEKYRDARILIAGPNFGCGSSREMAVWAIQGMGIRCIIAQSFGSIFYNNAFQNGILPVTLDTPRIEQLVRHAMQPGAAIEVDLEANKIKFDDKEINFEVPALERLALLEGLDQIGITLKHSADIALFEREDAAARPWLADRSLM